MDYIALRCIIGDDVYTKGEIIHDLPEEKAKRLLEKGAIREADAPFSSPAAEDEVDERQADEETEGQDDVQTVDCADEETEVPEIDAMDGVVTAPAEDKKDARKSKGGGKK